MSKANQVEQRTEIERLEENIRLLDAKAAHLRMKARAKAKELTRRQDAHEKVVLGACAKKVGLDRFRASTPSARPRSQTAGYDVELLLGAFAWLSDTLDSASCRTLPAEEALRERGRALLNDHFEP
jgi:hypothetical protein